MVDGGESTTWAVSLAALAGPFQALARLTEFARTVPSPPFLGVCALCFLSGSMWLLSVAGGAAPLLAAVAMYGIANGMLTVVRSVSLMDAAGPQAYARASGLALSPALGARAAGPVLAASALAGGVSYETLFQLLGAAGIMALVLFLGSDLLERR
jgi:hypothetical protein